MAKTVAICLLALCLFGCDHSGPTLPYVYHHFHAVACRDSGILDIFDGSTLTELHFNGVNYPICTSWNAATWWDISVIGSDGHYNFISAVVSR